MAIRLEPVQHAMGHTFPRGIARQRSVGENDRSPACPSEFLASTVEDGRGRTTVSTVATGDHPKVTGRSAIGAPDS